jgi:hypothetical protein
MKPDAVKAHLYAAMASLCLVQTINRTELRRAKAFIRWALTELGDTNLLDDGDFPAGYVPKVEDLRI